jgi:hypothetical protein
MTAILERRESESLWELGGSRSERRRDEAKQKYSKGEKYQNSHRKKTDLQILRDKP